MNFRSFRFQRGAWRGPQGPDRPARQETDSRPRYHPHDLEGIEAATEEGGADGVSGRETPNTKHQTPKKFQAPNPKRRSDTVRLELEIWSCSGVWSLVFGI